MKITTLKISADLELPLDAITERLGFLGTSGSGKTYGAGKLAEEMLSAGAQVIPIDPVGTWWGLRSSADGKRAGHPILVFGGIHADLPLTPESGALVADILVDRGISAVLDVSDMTVGQMHKFVSAFAERFFDRKKRNPSPVHIFLEESHTFLPQQLPPEPAAAVMLHRMERIVRVGRNYGIGTSQISQMPQAVTKKTLNMVACLFAFGTIGSQERKAVAAWFDQNGGGDLVKELPGLETGVAWAVSPRWLRITKKLKFAAKRTFDSSETPKFGGPPPVPKVLAPVDVEQLKLAMAETIAEAAKDDPTALRKRIAELERELKAKPAAAPAPKVETKVVEKPVLTEAQLRRFEAAAGRLSEEANAVLNTIKPVADAMYVVKASFGRPPPTFVDGAIPKSWTVTPRPAPRAPAEGPTTTTQAGGALGKGERALLEALAIRHPNPLTRRALGALAGYSASGGSFRTYLSAVRTAGLITEQNGAISLSAAGEQAVDVAIASAPRGSDAVIAMWRGRLGKGELALFDALIAAYPNEVTREDLGRVSGYESAGGSFRTYLSAIRTLGLVDTRGSMVRAAEEIFTDGGDR